MIELDSNSKNHVLVFRGHPEARGYDGIFTSSLETVLRNHDQAHVVFVWEGDFMGEQLHTRWDAEEFGRTHKDKIGKIAVVGESKWKEWAKKLIPHFGEENVQTYESDHLKEAATWAEETKVV